MFLEKHVFFFFKKLRKNQKKALKFKPFSDFWPYSEPIKTSVSKKRPPKSKFAKILIYILSNLVREHVPICLENGGGGKNSEYILLNLLTWRKVEYEI